MGQSRPRFLQCGRFHLPLSRPLIAGIVNVTPDSFSDGGSSATTAEAVAHALRLFDEGADIVDVGGESTRPGASLVAVDEELRRVLPVLERLPDVPVSIDTGKPAVMRAAIERGACMVNDIRALRVPGALEAVAASNAAVCLMHMQGEPQTMQAAPHYDDVVAEVRMFLRERVAAALAAGIGAARLVVDPGFGFGKSFEHSLALLRDLQELNELGVALMVGLSRKSMLGKITGREAGDRVHASVAAALLAVAKGARIVRVHDVRATRDALAVYNALQD